MKIFAGFPPEAIAAIVTISAAYFILTWSPVIWPLIATHQNRKEFPRRWLFVATITSLAYGAIVAFLFAVTLPISAYEIFIAPQLSENGFHLTDPLVRANQLVARYWWLMLPPALLFNTLYFVRKLKPAWPSICQALMANNSFKPTPLRGAA